MSNNQKQSCDPASNQNLTDEDAANIGRALMERLPKGYSWSDCPTEIVTDLGNQVHDLKASVAEACEFLRRGAALVAMAGDQNMALSMNRHAERILSYSPVETSTEPDFRSLLQEMWKFWGRPREQEFTDAGISVAKGMDLYSRVSAALGDPLCAKCTRRFSQHKTVISHDFTHRPAVEQSESRLTSTAPHGEPGLTGSPPSSEEPSEPPVVRSGRVCKCREYPRWAEECEKCSMDLQPIDPAGLPEKAAGDPNPLDPANQHFRKCLKGHISYSASFPECPSCKVERERSALKPSPALCPNGHPAKPIDLDVHKCDTCGWMGYVKASGECQCRDAFGRHLPGCPAVNGSRDE